MLWWRKRDSLSFVTQWSDSQQNQGVSQISLLFQILVVHLIILQLIHRIQILNELLLNKSNKAKVKKYYPHVNQSIRVANSVLSIGNSSQRKHRRTRTKSQIILNLKYGLNGSIIYKNIHFFRNGRTDPKKTK